MNKILLTLFAFLSFHINAESIGITGGCHIKDKTNADDSLNTPLICQEYSSDGETLINVKYSLTPPTLTEGGNCIYHKKKDNENSESVIFISRKEGGHCPKLLASSYISLEYVQNKEDIFVSVNLLLENLINQNTEKEDSFSIPFYKYWFCEDCKKFHELVISDEFGGIQLRSITELSLENQFLLVRITMKQQYWAIYLNRDFRITSIEKI